jgi:glycine/D-amino acid oxidase-like deaminating enzyme
MNIAIIGSGLSGLATAWFLLNKNSSTKVTLFDASGIGGGASGMAAGLMHPFSGAAAKLNRFGLEGYLASSQLLDIASQTLGTPVARYEGLLRLAITPLQQVQYRYAADHYPDLIWNEADESLLRIPQINAFPGLFIKKCATVDCPLYLKGLWHACELKGAALQKAKIGHLDELRDFDQVVVAAGAQVNDILGPLSVPIYKNKGQVLRLTWPEDLKPLLHAVNSHAYILMDSAQSTCSVGATYEKQFVSPEVDLDFAKQDIMPKAELILPQLGRAEIVGCRAGIRVSTPGHLPVVQKVDHKTWVITGMGSKGLLYHALYAKKLAESIYFTKNR